MSIHRCIFRGTYQSSKIKTNLWNKRMAHFGVKHTEQVNQLMWNIWKMEIFPKWFKHFYYEIFLAYKPQRVPLARNTVMGLPWDRTKIKNNHLEMFIATWQGWHIYHPWVCLKVPAGSHWIYMVSGMDDKTYRLVMAQQVCISFVIDWKWKEKHGLSVRDSLENTTKDNNITMSQVPQLMSSHSPSIFAWNLFLPWHKIIQTQLKPPLCISPILMSSFPLQRELPKWLFK